MIITNTRLTGIVKSDNNGKWILELIQNIKTLEIIAAIKTVLWMT